MTDYIPAVCNIGPAEIKKRKQGMWVGALLYVITAILFIVTGASTTARLISFIPAMIFSVGLVQVRNKYCVAFGFMGVFNFGKIGSVNKIEDRALLKEDRKHALNLIFKAVLLSLLLTLIVVTI